MELEEYLKKYDIKKNTINKLNNYLDEYRKNDEKDFNELFKGLDIDDIKCNFHSTSYVISLTNDSTHKYILARVRLKVVYNEEGEITEEEVAEYQSVYNLDGNFIDDEFIKD